MKTAISIPDQVFQRAEEAARRLGLSRSELYARAVAQFVEDFERETVTAALDRLYADEESRLDPGLEAMQAASLFQDEW